MGAHSTVKRHENNNKKQRPTNNHKKNRKLKNNRKIKVMRSIAPTMDQFSRDGYMEENDP